MQTIWILGDQLHEHNSALALANKAQDRLLFIESKKRGSHLRYHQIKLVLVYSAMRHWADTLRQRGWKVDYHELTDDFFSALKKQIKEYPPTQIVVEEPNDYTMTQTLPQLSKKLGISIKTTPSQQFLVSRQEFSVWAGKSSRLLMENHYRRLRKKLGILMTDKGQPEGGAWNFDAENRKTYSAFSKHVPQLPALPPRPPDDITREVIAMVQNNFPDHPGRAAKFWLPVTHAEAQVWLKDFVENRLNDFGPWEDVMVQDKPVLFHSVLSPLLNIGLISPQDCIQAAVEAYENKRAPLSSVEGFIRQIMGWREFVHGIYWLRMPEYTGLNELEAGRPLPDWFYDGRTEMNCLKQALNQVLETGYNHHIQRLMILGNFFLLGGFEPKAVLRWFNEMYVDAYDWVMAANVIGMILFADGGYMATKPYAAGAGYIKRMSNYCQGCRFDPDEKLGPKACPFNYLYWNFFAKHELRFDTNPRVSMMIKTWRSKSDSEQMAIRKAAKEFLDKTAPHA